MVGDTNIRLGVTGEGIACNYLINKGYKICQRNYKIGRAEVDIIARKKDAIYFVEVKTRRDCQFGSPIESVLRWKMRNINKVARFYISKNALEDKEIHFSIIGIDLSGEEPSIEFIEDAFTEDDIYEMGSR